MWTVGRFGVRITCWTVGIVGSWSSGNISTNIGWVFVHFSKHNVDLLANLSLVATKSWRSVIEEMTSCLLQVSRETRMDLEEPFLNDERLRQRAEGLC